jgi:flagellar biosynthesis protein FlhG
MNAFDEPDHYETLEIEPGATPDEIERSYRLLIATWADNSLATYSMFGDEETGSMRDRIESAYRVLADPELRRRYDAAQLSGAEEEYGAEAVEEPVVLAPLAEASLAKPLAEARREIPTFDRMDDVEEAEEGPEVPWDGARLRRARLLRGVEVEDVATATKISPAYLRFLEEERFDDLPAVVYVRGFVAAYARYLGLDAAHVSRSYGARFEEHRRAQPRGRQLGHR